MSRTKQWAFALVGVLFLVASTYFAQVYITAQQVGTTPQYFSPTTNQEIASNFILLVVIMLAGIIGSYLFEKLKNTPPGATIDLRAELSGMMSSAKFIMALVVSPLIFNSIYLLIGDNPQSIGDYLLAFQNGFFWESIVAGVVETREAESQEDASFS